MIGLFSIAGVMAACTHSPRSAGDERGAVLRVKDGERISYGRLAEELNGIDLIFVGEIHENAAHHAAQLRIVDELHWREVPLALGLEMFPAMAQPELDAWLADQLSDKVFQSLYWEAWRIPWDYYGAIFQRARTWKIPLIGINVPRRVVQKVFKNGFASLTPEDRRELPEEVTCEIDPSYREFIRRSFGKHAGSAREFEHFCEAQMLWTKGMARYLTKYLDSRPGRQVVVLTGASHALRKGIPEQIALENRYSSRIVLPELSDLTRKTVTLNEADYLILDPTL
jgi:uncharacterized iron-regulated protein